MPASLERGAIPNSGSDILVVVAALFREIPLGPADRHFAYGAGYAFPSAYRRDPFWRDLSNGNCLGYSLALGHCSEERVVFRGSYSINHVDYAASI